MNKNSLLCNFIHNHKNNWQELLSGSPYFLKIKTEGPLAIFNYNLLAIDMVETEDGEVTKTMVCDFSIPEVQEARGIIINTETEEVVCWPFRKFGNFGESYVDEIDWATAQVQEKVDGSIMKLWFNDLTNSWQISSNSMINASESTTSMGNSLKALFEEAAKTQGLDYSKLDKNKTYIFELVSPLNRVVIKYSNVEIYHTGTRNNITGVESVDEIGIKKPKKYPLHTLQDCIVAAEKLNAGLDKFELENEGFVVVDGNWHRIKVKSPDYVLVHHALNGGILSKKKMVRLILEGEAEEYLSYYPDYEKVFRIYEKKMEQIRLSIAHSVKTARELEKKYDNRKAIAKEVCKLKDKSWIFQALNGQNAEEIFENIRESKLIEMLDKVEV